MTVSIVGTLEMIYTSGGETVSEAVHVDFVSPTDVPLPLHESIVFTNRTPPVDIRIPLEAHLEDNHGFTDVTRVPVSRSGAMAEWTAVRDGITRELVLWGATPLVQEGIDWGATVTSDTGAEWAYQTIAIGEGAEATGEASIAVGYNAKSTDESSTAMGHDASATNTRATAVGRDSHASGLNSSAYGWGANATSQDSTAIGTNVSIGGQSATAIGKDITIDSASVGALAGGVQTFVTNSYNAVVLGAAASATNANLATAIGYSARAQGAGQAFVAGSQAEATDSAAAVVVGFDANASASQQAFVAGSQASASNSALATVIGYGSSASASNQSIAIGFNASVSGSLFAAALGSGAEVGSGSYRSYAIGAAAVVPVSTPDTTVMAAKSLQVKPHANAGTLSSSITLYDAAGNPHTITSNAAYGQTEFGRASGSPLTENTTLVVSTFSQAKSLWLTTLADLIPATATGTWTVKMTASAVVSRSVSTGGVYLFPAISGDSRQALPRGFPQANAYTVTRTHVVEGCTGTSALEVRYGGQGTAGQTNVWDWDADVTAVRTG